MKYHVARESEQLGEFTDLDISAGMRRGLHAQSSVRFWQRAYEALPHDDGSLAPPQYRTVQETVMVAPGRVVAHRTPAQYRTIMVPKTVMVAPEGVAYERIAPQYATQQRVEMVAPARLYYAPVAPRCSTCGY